MQYVQHIMVMKFKSALEGDLQKQFYSISFTQQARFDQLTQLPQGQRTASTVTDTAQVRPCGGLHLSPHRLLHTCTGPAVSRRLRVDKWGQPQVGGRAVDGAREALPGQGWLAAAVVGTAGIRTVWALPLGGAAPEMPPGARLQSHAERGRLLRSGPCKQLRAVLGMCACDLGLGTCVQRVCACGWWGWVVLYVCACLPRAGGARPNVGALEGGVGSHRAGARKRPCQGQRGFPDGEGWTCDQNMWGRRQPGASQGRGLWTPRGCSWGEPGPEGRMALGVLRVGEAVTPVQGGAEAALPLDLRSL